MRLFTFLIPGYVGPILRAEVGDVIIVHFKNAASAHANFSVHPHGIFYTKFHEGKIDKAYIFEYDCAICKTYDSTLKSLRKDIRNSFLCLKGGLASVPTHGFSLNFA